MCDDNELEFLEIGIEDGWMVSNIIELGNIMRFEVLCVWFGISPRYVVTLLPPCYQIPLDKKVLPSYHSRYLGMSDINPNKLTSTTKKRLPNNVREEASQHK